VVAPQPQRGGSLAQRIPRRELLLASVLALGVLAPLASRVSSSAPPRLSVGLPGAGEGENILYQHLIPDEPEAKGPRGPASAPCA